MKRTKRILKSGLALMAMTALIVTLFVPMVMNAEDKPMKYKELTPEEERVIVGKGTEMPYTGKYYDFHEDGTYACKRCGAALYKSADKFDAHCGWPSFDDAAPGAIKEIPDPDGMRTEINCANCGAHLGHVFKGEGFTDKNVRHCVNSISLDFLSAEDEQKAEAADSEMPTEQATMASATMEPEMKTEKAYFAGGCFWGVEYYLEQIDGVLDVRSGYMGGHVDNPTYRQVCSGTTGHAETVEVEFDPTETDFETVARTFFEIHDPTQMNRQGPDVGEQYRSAVFYTSERQKEVTDSLIDILKAKGLKVTTEVAAAGTFWPAETYHQDYYENSGKTPYCHGYTKRF